MLVLRVTARAKLCDSENNIITMIMLDFGAAEVIQPFFETFFIADHSAGTKRNLMLE